MRSTQIKKDKSSKMVEVLRLLRFVMGYSQAELEKVLLEDFNLSANLSDMERGKATPTIELIYAYETLSTIPAWGLCWLAEYESGYYIPPDPELLKRTGKIELDKCPAVLQGLAFLFNSQKHYKKKKNS